MGPNNEKERRAIYKTYVLRVLVIVGEWGQQPLQPFLVESMVVLACFLSVRRICRREDSLYEYMTGVGMSNLASFDYVSIFFFFWFFN